MADPLTSFTGVSSGLDWRALVDQITTLERRPAVKLEATISANTKRRDALNAFQGQLQALKDAADRLAGRPTTGASSAAPSPFESFTVSATGTNPAGRDVLAATASAGAAPGSYAVSVTALARGHEVTGGQNVPTAWTLGGTGGSTTPATLTLTRDGGTTPFASITVDPADGLGKIRDTINALNTGTTPSGVQASLINVSATEQRLVLTSSATGAAARFTVGDDGASGLAATLGLDAPTLAAQPALVQQGQDAAFSVDGVSMTRPTNAVSDVIGGVSLTLGVEGSATVNVTRQANVGADAMKAFADAYNAVLRTVGTQGRDPKSPLYNDALLRTVRGGLSGVMIVGATPASAPGGAPGVADDLTTLSALGLTLQKDGTLSFDASTFTSVSTARLADARAVLGERLGAVAGYVDTLARPLDGLIEQRESSLDIQNARLTSRVADIDARLEKRKAQLVAQYAKFEATLGRLKAIGEQMNAQFTGLVNSGKDS